MTNDLKELKEYFLKSEIKDNVCSSFHSFNEHDATNINELSVQYTKKGQDIVFSDGVKGRIKTYPGYLACSVVTKDGFELLYNNENAAISALYLYLTTGAS